MTHCYNNGAKIHTNKPGISDFTWDKATRRMGKHFKSFLLVKISSITNQKYIEPSSSPQVKFPGQIFPIKSD